MKLEIFDKETRYRIGMVKAYTYASYEDEFFGPGSFSVKIPVHDESLEMLVQGNYIFFDDGVVGIVKGRKESDSSDEEEIEVYGYLTNHVLSYRSFFLSTRFYDKIPAVFRKMADALFVNPEDPKRRIDFFRLSEDPKYFPDVEGKETVQRTGDSFLDVLSDISMTKDLGFRLHPVVEDVDPDSGSPNLSALEFRVIKPAYRTIDNEDGNDPVVFSFDLNNLQNLEYEEDGRTYASMALVASEGEGKDRKTLEVGDLTKEGIDRIEVYVDARDIQSDNGYSGEGEGGGGNTGTSSSNELWKPSVSVAGDISWTKSSSTTPPTTRNIKGQKGDKGDPGSDGSTGPAGPPGPQGEPGEIVDVNNYLGGLRFGENQKGEWGYIPPGADSVVPFSRGGGGGTFVLDLDPFVKFSEVLDLSIKTVFCGGVTVVTKG